MLGEMLCWWLMLVAGEEERWQIAKGQFPGKGVVSEMGCGRTDALQPSSDCGPWSLHKTRPEVPILALHTALPMHLSPDIPPILNLCLGPVHASQGSTSLYCSGRQLHPAVGWNDPAHIGGRETLGLCHNWRLSPQCQVETAHRWHPSHRVPPLCLWAGSKGPVRWIWPMGCCCPL